MSLQAYSALQTGSSRILRRPDVEGRSGLSRSSIYDGVKAGTFPAPVQLGAKAVGWLESDIEAWIAGRVKQTRYASNGKGA